MPAVEIRIAGLEAFARRLEALGKQGRLAAARAAASAMKTDVLLHFKQQQGPDGPWKPSRRAQAEGKKTLLMKAGHGGLYEAIAATFDEEKAVVGVLKSGPAASYARSHQYGLVYVAPAGKAIPIPWSKEAKAAAKIGTKPSDMPNLKLVWPKGSKTGWLVEYKKGRGKGGEGKISFKERYILHWMLVKKITIPPRPYLWLSEAGRKEALSRIGKALKNLIEAK